MESVVNYLEDTEKKMAKEMAELFSKMREQRDTMSLTGIEDMYNIEPVEGVLYDPCVGIPCGIQGITYAYAYVKLPKDEIIIDIFRHEYAINNHPHYQNRIYFFALTNYGRLIITNPVGHYRGPFEGRPPYNNSPTSLTIINNLELLPYKLPSWFYKIFKKLYGGLSGFLGSGGFTSSPSHDVFPSYETLNKLALDTTASLQELNKEFYLFAGKWKPHMTKHATFDIDTMRQTIIENAASIQELSEKNKSLKDQNTRLQAELKVLKEQKKILEKEKKTLLPLENYKQAVLEFLEEYNEEWSSNIEQGDDDNIIKYFDDLRCNNVFIDKFIYHELMESKEELNEYRIYKKVKAEMVSSGMDNSSVSRNVNSIKKSVKKVKNIICPTSP